MKCCKSCGGLLQINTLRGELEYRCRYCARPHESSPEDTLIYEEILEQKNYIEEMSEVIKESAPYHNATPVIDEPCKTCKMRYKYVIRMEGTGRPIYICKNCG